MARIAIFIHGRGQGHTVRSAAIAERLKQELPESSVEVFGPERSDIWFKDVDAYHSIPPIPRGLGSVVSIVRQRSKYKQTLKERGFDLVISDGEPAGMLAAKNLDIPTIAVGHHVIFSRAELPPGMGLIPVWYERLNGALSTVFADAAVGASFVPLEPKTSNTIIARPDLRWDKLPEASDHGQYLAYFRDGDDGGLVQQMCAQGGSVRIYGSFDGELPEGAEQRPFDNDGFLKDLAQSRGVLATGGSNLITESTYLGKPIFAIHKKLDMEQRLNIELLKTTGIGTGCSIGEVTKEKVRKFKQKVETHKFRVLNLETSMIPVSKAALAKTRDLL